MKIKRFIYGICSCLVLASLFAGCSGNIDVNEEKETLYLSADVEEIIADGKTAVTFTVLYGTEDVTSQASVKCVSGNAEVSGNSFVADAIGTYVFRAFYDDVVSEDVEVVAKSRFQRRVCVMEFTGTWCAQCPAGATTLNFLISRTYKDQAFALAFHNDDPFALPVETELHTMFGCGSYPAYVTDMRDAGLLNDGGCSESIEKSLYESETHCSVSVSCSYDRSSGKVNVTSGIFSEKDASYRLAAYVIEDKVKGEQAQADGTVDKDYVHRHVVRQMLSASVKGDDMGRIAAGSEKTSSYSFAADKGWNIDNVSVAVLAVDEEGHVNNMAICSADGGNMEYGYIK